VLFADKAEVPKAELKEPVVFAFKAVNPNAALLTTAPLPLPTVSPFMVASLSLFTAGYEPDTTVVIMLLL
jgi:hypothetical protein